MNSDEPPRFSIPDVKPFDPKKLYGVQGGGPQYINVDNKKGRDTMSDMFFWCGLSWSAGLVAALPQGLYHGFHKSPTSHTKVRANSMMNSVGSYVNNYTTKLGSGMFVYLFSCVTVEGANALFKANMNFELLDETFGQPMASGSLAGVMWTLGKSHRVKVLAGVIGAAGGLAGPHIAPQVKSILNMKL